MKLTNGDIFMAREPLSTLIGMRFPVGVSFKLARMVKRVNDSLEAIQTTKAAILNKYGDLDKATGQKTLPPTSPRFADADAEWKALLDIEIEVDIEKVKLPEEVDGKPLEVEPSLLMALEKFVE